MAEMEQRHKEMRERFEGKRKSLMVAFYQEFKDTDIFLKRQSKK